MEQRWIPKLGTRIIRIRTEQHYIINKVEKHFFKKEVKYHLKQEDGPVDLIVRYDELKTLFSPIKQSKQTNADRIRSMTDEELLDFLCSIETFDNGSVKTIEGGVAMCSVTEVEEWLRAESEG